MYSDERSPAGLNGRNTVSLGLALPLWSQLIRLATQNMIVLRTDILGTALRLFTAASEERNESSLSLRRSDAAARGRAPYVVASKPMLRFVTVNVNLRVGSQVRRSQAHLATQIACMLCMRNLGARSGRFTFLYIEPEASLRYCIKT